MDGYSIKDAIAEHAREGDASCQKYMDDKKAEQRIIANQKTPLESAAEGLDTDIDDEVVRNRQDEKEGREEGESQAKSSSEQANRKAEPKQPESVRETIENSVEEIRAEDVGEVEEKTTEQNKAPENDLEKFHKSNQAKIAKELEELDDQIIKPALEKGWKDRPWHGSHPQQQEYFNHRFYLHWAKDKPNFALVEKEMGETVKRAFGNYSKEHVMSLYKGPKAFLDDVYEIACGNLGINPDKKHVPVPKKQVLKSTAPQRNQPKKYKPVTVSRSIKDAMDEVKRRNAR